MENFREMAAKFSHAGAAVQVNTPEVWEPVDCLLREDVRRCGWSRCAGVGVIEIAARAPAVLAASNKLWTPYGARLENLRPDCDGSYGR